MEETCQEADCGLPVLTERTFILEGTHSILFRRVACPLGHWYIEEVAELGEIKDV